MVVGGLGRLNWTYSLVRMPWRLILMGGCKRIECTDEGTSTSIESGGRSREK
jgi:hypothetical protein